MKLKTSEFLLGKKAELKQIVDILAKEFSYVSILGTDVSGKGYTVRTTGATVNPPTEADRSFVVCVYQDSGFSEYSFNHLDVEAVCKKVREIAGEDRDAF